MSDVLTDLNMAGYSTQHTGDHTVTLLKDWAMICCCFHQDDTPSLSINLKDGHGYYCFGCGASGKYSDLRKVLLPELYGDGAGSMSAIVGRNMKVGNAMARFQSANNAANAFSEVSERISRINDFEQNAGVMVPWQDDWRNMSGDFLRAFGGRHWVSRELNSSRTDLVDVPRIYFPFKHPKYTALTIGYAARRLDDQANADAPKYRNSSVIPTKHILYLMSAIQMRSPIVVVEGPFDALKLWYHGIPAVASLGTNQWSDHKTAMILSKVPDLVIGCGDGDEAGYKFNNVLFNTFRHIMPKKYIEVKLPEGLDPGGFDDAWIKYMYDNINNTSNGALDRLRLAGQNYITKIDNSMLAGV